MFSVALAWKEEVTKKWHIHISIWWHSFWNILIEICSWYGNICQQFFKNSYFIFILLSFFRFILQNSTQDYLRFVSLVYVCFFGFFLNCIFLLKEQLKHASGARLFRCVEDPLMTLSCFCSIVELLSLWFINHFHSLFYKHILLMITNCLSLELTNYITKVLVYVCKTGSLK